jgi:hypothetical protein
MFERTYLRQFGDHISDPEWMAAWYRRYNEEVIDAIPPVGWESLCEFLGAPVPAEPFPRVNSRDEFWAAADRRGALPSNPEGLEAFASDYIEALRAKAFAPGESI